METQHIPAYIARNAKGVVYARVAQTRFPGKQGGEIPLLHRITAYNGTALWDGVQAWFDGGPAASGRIDPRAASVHTFNSKGGATWQINLPNVPRDKKVPLAWSSFAMPVAIDDITYGYRWAKGSVTNSNANDGALVTLPEFYRLEKDKKDKKDKDRWRAVSANDVPAETGLAKVEFPQRRGPDRRPLPRMRSPRASLASSMTVREPRGDRARPKIAASLFRDRQLVVFARSP
jgi:hypothetical protein